MKCFELVKSVLDEQFKDVPGTAEEKKSKIGKALDALGETYRAIADSPQLDYRDPCIRFAYIYR